MANIYGREKILLELKDLLTIKNGTVKVIGIEGEPGIGKTLIADKLCNEEDIINHFTYIHTFSAYDSSWERIVRALAGAIIGFNHMKGDAGELENQIVNEAKGTARYVVCIDNVDDSELMDQLLGFIEKWEKVSESVLLLTGQKLSETIGKDYCECVPIEGLTERGDLENLLGKELCDLFPSDDPIWDRIQEVTRGNPQKLRYLRWLKPETLEKFRENLNRLEQDDSEDQTDTAMEAIRTGLINLNVPFEHFLSIANLRHTVFSGTVLAFLWDRLGGGGSEYYERSLKHLLREGLLDIHKESGGVIKYRMNTTLHGRLQNAFKELVTPERQAQILFFLGDYFRARFIKGYANFLHERKEYKGHDKKEPFPVEELDAYITHTTDGGYVHSAFQYLFSRGIVEWAHSAGSALGLVQILKTLCTGIERMRNHPHTYPRKGLKGSLTQLEDTTNKIIDDIYSQKSCTLPGTIRYHLEGIKNSIPEYLAERDGKDSPDAELEAMAAVVRAALGRAYKDLNQHNKALDCLQHAKRTLEDKTTEKEIENKLEEFGLRRLKADLYHYLGIVYSVTGRAVECLEAYFEGINYAAENDCFHSRDALSLGYLAYEMKFYDIEAALKMAEDSVILAERTNDNIVTAKNLCTQGQIKSFQQKWEDAYNLFSKADMVLDGKDDREACRIKVDKAVNHIYKRKLQEARRVLNSVTESFGKTGDRRRIAVANAYLGIIEFLNGNENRGIKILLDAFNTHLKIGTKREAIYEGMTILWMRGLHSSTLCKRSLEEYLKKVSKLESPFDIILQYLNGLTQQDQIYVNFWRNHYLPTLLIGID